MALNEYLFNSTVNLSMFFSFLSFGGLGVPLNLFGFFKYSSYAFLYDLKLLHTCLIID